MWLLIFDNADNLNILRDFWPESDCESILIISRDSLAKIRTHASISIDMNLPSFNSEKAGQLLCRLTEHVDTANVAPSEEIARKLSKLPLALNQIAETIERCDLAFDEFLELYNQEFLRSDFHRDNILSDEKILYTI